MSFGCITLEGNAHNRELSDSLHILFANACIHASNELLTLGNFFKIHYVLVILNLFSTTPPSSNCPLFQAP